jgi:hypothetical protein
MRMIGCSDEKLEEFLRDDEEFLRDDKEFDHIVLVL